jgi:chitin-binding protein
VYEVPRNATPDAPIAVPTPLTSEPVAATEFAQSDISLGTERCFAIRAVDIIDGVHVRGPASPTACAAFADTFVPSAPRDLVAVAVPGGVNLIWEPSEAKDVAGYVVLRGQAGSDTLTPLIETPLTTPSYRDEAVTAGVRYVYAVVAVDRAGNRSAESNRVEETAQ